MKNNMFKHRGLWKSFKQVILCGFLFSFYGCGRAGDTPLFETPEWKMNPEYKVGLSLRREEKGQNQTGTLLIKHDSKTPFVRRYDPVSRTLEVATPESWDQATAPIARCEEQFAPETRLLEVKPETGRLTDENGKVVPTKGENVLNLTESPRKNRAAILSASGAAGSGYSIFPFGSGSGASGQYWHETYSLENRKIESSPVRVPTERSFRSLRACWSADEKFVVYYEVTFSFLTVIHVE